jgi:adenylate cyclase class 1
MFLRIIEDLPDELKLVFIEQYTMDILTIRKDLYHLIRPLADKIKDTQSLTLFLASIFDQGLQLDPLTKDICSQTRLLESVLRNEVEFSESKQKRPSKTKWGIREKIQSLKTLALLGSRADLLRCIQFLRAGIENDIRLAVLRILQRADLKGDHVIDAVSSLLNEEDDSLIFAAFRTLISLNPRDISQITIRLLRKYPEIRARIFGAIPELGMVKTREILKCLTPEERSQARATIVETLTERNTKLKRLFLKAGLESPVKEIRDQSQLMLKEITDPGERTHDQAGSLNHAPLSIEKNNKGFTTRVFSNFKKRLFLKKLIKRIPLDDVDLSGVKISGLDLSRMSLSNVDFSGAVLKEVDFSSAKFSSVNFSGASLEGVNLEGAYLDSVNLACSSLKSISGINAVFSTVDFSNSLIHNSDFREAEMKESIFDNAKILNSDFSLANLEGASFFEAEIRNTVFIYSNLQTSDLSYASVSSSDFSGSDISMSFTYHSESIEGLSSEGKTQISSPLSPIFFEDSAFKVFQKVFDALILSGEINKQKGVFFKYNKRRTEIALESFTPEQADLFELIPLLIHTGENLFLYDGFVNDSPKGIYNYVPTYTTLKKVKKYFPKEKIPSILKKRGDIQTLLTMGSIGSVAQSKDSDIDYWVCIDAKSLGKKKLKQLRLKLEAISTWASKIFRNKVYFFIVDEEKARQNDFGSSDKESSGSAQGQLLKEELYRTMIFIAGKLPLWWLLPANLNDRFYQYRKGLASILKEDSIDLGNVGSIPLSEYFGASIWQILKGLTSPYKSVMKMALLEKYIVKGENYQLLCNKLQRNYNRDSIDLKEIDPYVLLLEEVLRYYQERGDADSLIKIQKSFYQKLGLRSLYDLRDMVSIDKKGLIFEYLDMWNLDGKKIQYLDQFKGRSFKRLVEQSTDIKKYMIKTYRKIASGLGKGKDSMISPKDLTIFGRIIASQFIQKEGKVDRLMMVSPAGRAFKKFFIKYERQNTGITWKLTQLSETLQKEKAEEILKIAQRIELLAAWMINNGLFSTETSTSLYPNPSPISIQDVQDLLRELARVFPKQWIEDIHFEDLLRDNYIKRILVILNFGKDRREKKIFEYTAIYDNSWGERFCQTFFNKIGLLSKEEVLKELKTSLDLPFKRDIVRFYAPQKARKYLSANIS